MPGVMPGQEGIFEPCAGERRGGGGSGWVGRQGFVCWSVTTLRLAGQAPINTDKTKRWHIPACRAPCRFICAHACTCTRTFTHIHMYSDACICQCTLQGLKNNIHFVWTLIVTPSCSSFWTMFQLSHPPPQHSPLIFNFLDHCSIFKRLHQ